MLDSVHRYLRDPLRVLRMEETKAYVIGSFSRCVSRNPSHHVIVEAHSQITIQDHNAYGTELHESLQESHPPPKCVLRPLVVADLMLKSHDGGRSSSFVAESRREAIRSNDFSVFAHEFHLLEAGALHQQIPELLSKAPLGSKGVELGDRPTSQLLHCVAQTSGRIGTSL